MSTASRLRDALRKRLQSGRMDPRMAAATAILDSLAVPTSSAGSVSSHSQLASILNGLQEDRIFVPSDTEQDILAHFSDEFPAFNAAYRHGALHLSEDSEQSNINPNISIVTSPHFSSSFHSVSLHESYPLANDVVTRIENVYFLHTLATSPARVIPAGKTLRSMLSGPQAAATLGEKIPDTMSPSEPTLHQKVGEIAHRAFWDEAVESLSSIASSTHISRLQRLYTDLHTKLGGVIPESQPLMVLLSSPLSPTSNPLLSAMRHIEEVANALKTRCAPIRDEAIDSVIEILQDSSKPRPNRVVEAIKQLFDVIDIMKRDMTKVLLNTVSDENLQQELARQARAVEVELIMDIWPLDAIRTSWSDWVQPFVSADGEVRWINALVHSLGHDQPLRCLLPAQVQRAERSPSGQSDSLPLPFLFTFPTVIRIQNYLQAITIAATLRTLVPSTEQSNDKRDPDSMSFLERVLSLLVIEVNEEPDSGTTKLLNLADEVIREHARKSGPISNEQTLRSAVDRLLRPTDPVCSLLRRRLLVSIGTHISSAMLKAKISAPNIMHTGRATKRPKTEYAGGSSLNESETFSLRVTGVEVRGYEDEAFRSRIVDVSNEICKVVEWTVGCWGDLIVL